MIGRGPASCHLISAHCGTLKKEGGNGFSCPITSFHPLRRSKSLPCRLLPLQHHRALLSRPSRSLIHHFDSCFHFLSVNNLFCFCFFILFYCRFMRQNSPYYSSIILHLFLFTGSPLNSWYSHRPTPLSPVPSPRRRQMLNRS